MQVCRSILMTILTILVASLLVSKVIGTIEISLRANLILLQIIMHGFIVYAIFTVISEKLGTVRKILLFPSFLVYLSCCIYFYIIGDDGTLALNVGALASFVLFLTLIFPGSKNIGVINIRRLMFSPKYILTPMLFVVMLAPWFFIAAKYKSDRLKEHSFQTWLVDFPEWLINSFRNTPPEQALDKWIQRNPVRNDIIAQHHLLLLKLGADGRNYTPIDEKNLNFLLCKLNDEKEIFKQIVKTANKELAADISLFGSSVIMHGADNKGEELSVDRLLAKYTDRSVGRVSSAAWHLSLFEIFADYYVKNSGRFPTNKLLVFEINMRSFSPSWYNRPKYRFSNFINIYKKMTASSALDFSDEITEPQFLRTPVFMWDKELETVSHFEYESHDMNFSKDQMINKMIIYNYLYKPLSVTNERIKSIGNIAKMCKGKIPVLFYFTPLRHMYGDKYTDNNFSKIVTKHRDTIKAVMDEHEIPYLDLTFALPDMSDGKPNENFFTDEYPNEHLKLRGRQFVAKQIADWFNLKINATDSGK